jgi:glutathione peroxidase
LSLANVRTLFCVSKILMLLFSVVMPGGAALADLAKGDATCGADLVSDVKTEKLKSLYDFEVKSIDGTPVMLSKYKGKVLLVVNTASRCGFTSQYKELQNVYAKYEAKGFAVLAFPSNDFLGQEPGTNKDIKEFCETNFNTKFPLFEKGPVKGDAIQPLFRYLTTDANPKFTGPVSWNFEKFVIDRQGKLIGRFKSRVNPASPEITKAIESGLNEKAAEKSKDEATCS